ncbi:hypothetical protein H9P43_010074 [Blastocladiella emersonii ATCC 22665]|nr:hypothetical protein H9P43_010074 [Blastocladiella emersonii ATCC 22665]
MYARFGVRGLTRRILSARPPKGLIATAAEHVRAERPYARAHGPLLIPLAAQFAAPAVLAAIRAMLKPLVVARDGSLGTRSLAGYFGLALAVEVAVRAVAVPLNTAAVRLALDSRAAADDTRYVVLTRGTAYPEEIAACLATLVREEGGPPTASLWRRMLAALYRGLPIELAGSVFAALVATADLACEDFWLEAVHAIELLGD